MHGRLERVALSRLVDSPWSRNIGNTSDLEASFTRGAGQILQNIVVRKRRDGQLEVLAGARRVRAARAIGWSHVDARLVDVDDEQAEIIFWEENVRRKQLSTSEQRMAMRRLANLVGGRGHGGDRRSVAARSSGHGDHLNVSVATKLARITGKSERQMRRYLAPVGVTRKGSEEVVAGRLRQALRIAQRCLDELGSMSPELKAEVRAAILQLRKSVK